MNKIENLYTYTGYKFRDYRAQVLTQGNKDWLLNKQQIFFNNYKSAFEKYSHFSNYKKWQIILDYYKRNPAGFYNATKLDIDLIDLTYNSDETFTEAEFDRFIETFLENSVDAEEIRSRFSREIK